MHGSIECRAHFCELSSHPRIGGLLLQFFLPLASSRHSVIIAGLKRPSHEGLANPVLIQQGEEWYAIRAWWASSCISGVCAELANTKYMNGERMAHQWRLQPFLPVGFKLPCDLLFCIRNTAPTNWLAKFMICFYVLLLDFAIEAGFLCIESCFQIVKRYFQTSLNGVGKTREGWPLCTS